MSNQLVVSTIHEETVNVDWEHAPIVGPSGIQLRWREGRFSFWIETIHGESLDLLYKLQAAVNEAIRIAEAHNESH